VPAPIGGDVSSKVELREGRLSLSGDARGHATAELFPIESPGVRFGDPEARVEAGRFHAGVDVRIDAANARGRDIVVRGVITLGTRADDPSYEFDVPVPGPAAGERAKRE
jgi:hypothetical protein